MLCAYTLTRVYSALHAVVKTMNNFEAINSVNTVGPPRNVIGFLRLHLADHVDMKSHPIFAEPAGFVPRFLLTVFTHHGDPTIR